MYGLRRGLPSARLINLSLLRMKEAGLVKKLRQRHAAGLPECASISTVSFR